MDWRTGWLIGMYGSMAPSRARRATMNGITTAALLAVYGAWAEFVPSELSADVGGYLSCVVTLLVSLFVWHGYWTGRIPWGSRPRRWIARCLCMAPIPFLIFGASWLVTVRAIPDLATRVFGTETARSMHLEASYRSRRRGCDHQLRGDELRFPGYICVPASDFYHFGSSGEVTIIGKATILGFHIVQATPGASLFAAHSWR